MTALVLAVLISAYDPLAADGGVSSSEFVVKDEARSREVPVRVYVPNTTSAAPVILFSHGLGGSNDGNVFLGEHWARRGYVAVFLQHPGSDEGVWKELPREERKAALERAASLESFMDRVRDVSVVLDVLAKWNETKAHALFHRLELSRVGMSGHSFGAVTTQAVSGQQFPLGMKFAEPRIKAAMALSPSLPRRGSAESAFAKVTLPWLLMTGTADAAPIGGQTAESRRGVFKALPAGGKYELVLEGAEHSAFTDRSLPGDSLPRNPNHHRVVRAFSTAFFDAYLKKDDAAKAWLDGEGAKSLLEKSDLWQRK